MLAHLALLCWLHGQWVCCLWNPAWGSMPKVQAYPFRNMQAMKIRMGWGRSRAAPGLACGKSIENRAKRIMLLCLPAMRSALLAHPHDVYEAAQDGTGCMHVRAHRGLSLQSEYQMHLQSGLCSFKRPT